MAKTETELPRKTLRDIVGKPAEPEAAPAQDQAVEETLTADTPLSTERVVEVDHLHSDTITLREVDASGTEKISLRKVKVAEEPAPRSGEISWGERARAIQLESQRLSRLAEESIIPSVDFWEMAPLCSKLIVRDGNGVQLSYPEWCVRCPSYSGENVCAVGMLSLTRCLVRTERPGTREEYDKLIAQGGQRGADTDARVAAKRAELGAIEAQARAKVEAELSARDEAILALRAARRKEPQVTPMPDADPARLARAIEEVRRERAGM